MKKKKYSTTAMSIRLPTTLYNLLVEFANEQQKSMNLLIRESLEKTLKKDNKEVYK